MRNTITEPYQVWFPGRLVWELWFVDRRKGARLIDTCEDSRLLSFKKNRRLKVLALPSGSQKPRCFESSATGEVDLRKEATAEVLREKPEGDIEGIGIEPIFGYPPNTTVRIDVPVVGKRISEFPDHLSPDRIVPAAALVKIPQGDMAVWSELRRLVFASAKHGGTAFYRELEGSRKIDRVRDCRRLIKSLKTKGLVGRSSALHVWDESNLKQYIEVLDVKVYPGYRPDPSNLRPALGMQPRRYREAQAEKMAKKKRFSKRLISISAMVGLALLATAGHTAAYLQAKQQQDSIVMNASEADRLGMIKSQWEDMAPAVDRNASVLEIWRKLFTMPSSSKINISRMSIGRDSIELTCEAKDNTVALKYIDELVKVASLGEFSWDYTNPEMLRNGTTLFVLKGFK